MDTARNSTSAPTSKHPIDVIADLSGMLICLRAMIGFAEDACEDALAFLDKPRDPKKENDIIVAMTDIRRRTSEIELVVRNALATHDHQCGA